jgi:hypothetical protein
MASPSGEGGPEGWIPAVETEETDDAYVIRAELPGMKRTVWMRRAGLDHRDQVTTFHRADHEAA